MFMEGDGRRLWLLALVVGLAGGVAGVAYIKVLKGTTNLLGPQTWSRPAHLAVLAATGVAIAGLTRLLGNPGDVELLVDNIHVGERANLRALRPLIPVSLIGIGIGARSARRLA